MRLPLPVFILALAPLAQGASTPDAASQAFEQTFQDTVHPFIQTYCLSCHSGEQAKAELDLTAYGNLASVTGDFKRWNLILERLKAKEMPPKEAPHQPSADERQAVQEWIAAVNAEEAQRRAGDPGLVLARRLSNAEYDYTIHDLTGVDLRPTKEFPVDPANQAGFDNSGESLDMSPALFKKYYQAARDVADHVVLEPDGLAFAPNPMLDESDRDKYSVLRIVDFYQRQPTDFAAYFFAAWRFQHRAALGQPEATLAEIARDCKVSPKYLSTVWDLLSDPAEQVGPLAKLQARWRALPAPGDTDPSALRARTEEMRDFVVNLRDKIIPDVPNISAPGLGPGSQPMVLWKDNQMAANRRTYDPALLQPSATPPAPETISAVAETAPAPATAPATPAVSTTPTAVNVLAAAQGEGVAKVNPTPAFNAKLPSGLGLPVAPVAKTAADGRPLSALEIADLALAAQPARKAGGPLPKTPDIVKFGGVFLEAPVTTTNASATARMALAKKHAGEPDPDLYVPEDPAQRARYEAAFAKFAEVFPDAFYISERARVYLDPEVEESLEGRLLSAGLHSQTGYFRDDGPLYEMILDDDAKRELDHLWNVFEFNAAIPARMHVSFLFAERDSFRDSAFDQYRPENKAVTSQEMIKSLADILLAKAQEGRVTPVALQAVKDHFDRVASDNRWLEETRVAAEPVHLQALLTFAERSYRRPLTAAERADILSFYKQDRTENGAEHEDAIRDSLVRVLMSPYFLYHLELDSNQAVGQPASRSTAITPKGIPISMAQGGTTAGTAPASTPPAFAPPANTRPLSDYELANRLSYFLWSSMPDQELLAHAAAGDLHQPEVLLAQTRRLLQDGHIQNFAVEFGGNWLDFRRFEEHNAVDRDRFPAFTNNLREAMFQEPVHFLVDLVQADRPVLNLLYANYTFVNPILAQHYGIPNVNGAPDQWVRVDDASAYGRGGLLPMAVFLTVNSPGLRTSPVKRGNWVVRRLLGENIPAPPPNVPVLPADEAQLGNLTLAQTLARHHTDPNCASCHEKFDSFGLVFEGYGPVGEARTKDLADHPVELKATFPDGTEESGVAGLRDYIKTKVQNEFVDNLCRKLLSYSLGRTLLPSDDLLVQDMRARLASSDYRFSPLVEAIVTSPQFLTKRAPAGEPVRTAMSN